MKRLVLISLLIVLSGQVALAQNSQAYNHLSGSTAPPTRGKSVVSQDDPVAKALEQAINRLAVAEEKNRLLEARIQAKDATIQALEGTIKVRDQQIELVRSANQDRIQVNTGDARVLQACEKQLSKAEARIYALEHPGFLKSLFKPETLFSFGAGYGFGKLTK